MPAPLLLQPAAELLHTIVNGNRPAAKQMEMYFRARREMGVRDRGAVAETVYACLRWKRLLEHCVPVDAPSAEDVAAVQLLRAGISARALEQAGYRGDARALATAVRTLDPAALSFAVRASLPDWLAERLRTQYGDSDAEKLADALNRPAPVDMRVNTLKAKREQVQQRLKDDGIDAEPTPYAPAGLRRHDRAPLFHTAAFQEGWFEVQDEGSQLLALLLEPRRGEMVVDFCAGAGGKTLHLGSLMANSGTLYAFDTAAHRLERLKPRLARAGLSNVRSATIAHERDDRVTRLHGKIDRVLVDAPCSGTGTLRRNPDIKWRAGDLAALAAVQRRLLPAAAALVKPGGRLVYGTCSVLREENEDIVSEFMGAHPEFAVVPVGAILARRHVALEMPDDALRLLPHVHGTDGFYAVALERRQKTENTET